MSTERVFTDAAPAPIGPYSQAIRVDGWIFCSGQIPLDPQSGNIVEGDVGAQTERVLRNLEAVLAASGCSFTDVVKTTIFLANMQDFAAVNAVYERAFGTGKPARSTVAVSGLPRGVLVEIDAIALKA